MKLAKFIKYAITIILLCSLQVSLGRFISVYNIVPNLVLVFVISISVINGPIEGAIIGLICGVFTDSLSTGTSIIYSLIYMYFGVICGVLNINYLRNNAGVVYLFTFIFSIICEEIIHFIHFTIWGVSGLFSSILYPTLPTAIYSTIVAIPLYYIIRAIFAPKKGDYIR